MALEASWDSHMMWSAILSSKYGVRISCSVCFSSLNMPLFASVWWKDIMLIGSSLGQSSDWFLDAGVWKVGSGCDTFSGKIPRLASNPWRGNSLGCSLSLSSRVAKLQIVVGGLWRFDLGAWLGGSLFFSGSLPYGMSFLRCWPMLICRLMLILGCGSPINLEFSRLVLLKLHCMLLPP